MRVVGGREVADRTKSLSLSIPFVTPPPKNTTCTHLHLGSWQCSCWPGHCKIHREGETVFEMATWAAGGQLYHSQGDSIQTIATLNDQLNIIARA